MRLALLACLPAVLMAACAAPPTQVAEADKPACAKEYTTGSAIRGVKCRNEGDRDAAKRNAQDTVDSIRSTGRVMTDPSGTR
jgi:hypothetical protein